MDKETLSKYGWVVIVIIVLVILMSFAAPFGQYFYDSTMAMVESLKSATNIEQLFTPNGGENGGTQEVVTNYTSAQIEADEHLYAIGKTQPEYVVAEFNDDYTEVVITKNGDESDGLMMDWITYEITNGSFQLTSLSSSPFNENRNTLSNVIIKNGVINIGGGAFYNCKSDGVGVSNITIPDTIQSIGCYAFSDCDYLQSITIPASVISIDVFIFSEYSGKITIYGYKGSYVETWVAETDITDSACRGAIFIAIDESPETPEAPDASDYKVAEQWINENGIDDTVKSLSETYGTSYYASLLLALAVEDDAVFAEALPLAQQSDAAIEEYFNTNMGLDINDFFKENIGATAHQIAYYIENGSWPA